MKRILSLCAFIAASAMWCPASFAQVQTAVGPGFVPLNATGETGGVAITGNGTLTVGVVGGPQTNIFTNNSSGNPALIAVSTGASSQGNIVFNSGSTVFGAIGVTQPGGPFLLDISGGNAGTAVNFQGPVFATITTVSGTGSLNFNSGSTNISATIFAADGTISLAPNTTLIGALTTTAGANTGTLSLGGGSVLDGAVGGAIGVKAINVVGGSNLAGVTASISGAVDAFSFNLGTNTLNIGGALTIANQGSTGVINTTLASPTVFGNIRPVGVTNLGPSLLVNVTVPPTAFYPVGTRFNIVQTQTGTPQSGTPGSVVAVTVQNPTNPLYTFSAVPPAGTVAGLVAIEVTGIPLQVVADPVVPALLAGAPSILAPINALAEPAAIVNATAQLVPSASDLAAPLVAFEGSREFNNLWESHLDDTMCGQVRQPSVDEQDRTCRQNEPKNGWWLKGFGYFGDQGRQDASMGYNSTIGGVMMAYEVPLAPDTRVGLGVGYARSVIDGKTFDADIDFNTYKATAYIGHEGGPWFVYGDASFGWDDYSGRRHVSFPGFDRTAGADYSGQEYTATLTTGYHFFAQGYTITPLASIQYTHLDLDSYTETGAGDIDLKVGSQSYDFAESSLGATVVHPFSYQGGHYVPEVHGKWLHELNNPTLQSTATFGPAGAVPFTTQGLKTSDDTFDVGAGFTILSCACTAKTWTLEAIYDFYWRTDNYAAQQGMIKLTERF